ncbi:MAG: gliding motility lipoprotein GldH [Bacteroidales bacterium]
MKGSLRVLITGILLGTVVIFSSCNRNVVINKMLNTPTPYWNYNDPLNFKVVITDTNSTYNCFLSISHTKDYPWMNTFFLITTTFPNMEIKTDTIECLVADYQGKWIGQGIGKYKNISYLFKRHIRFPIPGEYQFEIQQAMRIDTLSEIKRIGLKIMKNPQ